MANSITKAQKYIPILDEIYKENALTANLDAPADLIREGQMANTILLPKISMDGLGNYSRSSGHVSGDVDLTWQTHTLSQDRGRKFNVDNMDNLETAEVAFGRLSGDFIRTKVVPEIDAYRFSVMSSNAGNSKEVASITSTNALTEFDAAMKTFDDSEVPNTERVCYVSTEMFNALKSADGIQRRIDINTSNGVIDRNIFSIDGVQIIKVPKTRFYTAITLYDGSTSGQEAGGYIKNASTGKDINFILVHRPSVLGVPKHIAPRVFDPNTNQDADAWRFDYRIYHDLFVLENKTNGIYLCNKAS